MQKEGKGSIPKPLSELPSALTEQPASSLCACARSSAGCFLAVDLLVFRFLKLFSPSVPISSHT